MGHLSNRSQTEKKIGDPDGVEAWCVALSACFVNFVMAGLGRMSGILYVEFINMFQVDRLQASLPFSARSSARYFLGPVVGILGQKYGVRATTAVGGIIGTLSTLLCFYAPNILWITILWGVINGTATALCTTLPQVVLAQHFKKHISTASSLAFSGCCVGSFLFPVLLEYLLLEYGLGGAFVIFAGIIMNVIPAALILKKPSWSKTKPGKETKISTIHEEIKNKANASKYFFNQNKSNENHHEIFIKGNGVIKNCDNGQYHANEIKHTSLTQDTLCWKNIDTDFLRKNNILVMKLLSNINTSKEKRSNKVTFIPSVDVLQKQLEDLYRLIDCNSKETRLSTQTLKTASSDCSDLISESSYGGKNNTDVRKEILLSSIELSVNNTANFKEFLFNCCKIIAEDKNNTLSLFPNDEHNIVSAVMEQIRHIYGFLENNKNCDAASLTIINNNLNEIGKENKSRTQHSNTLIAHIKTSLKLHKNPLFLLICLSRSVHFLVFIPALTIVVDFSMDRGLPQDYGKYVISALSFGDLLGRLCLGWVTDRGYLSLPRYMLLVTMLQGACTASLALMTSKAALMSLIVLFGLLQGSLFVRHTVLVSKYLDSHEQSVGIGCINLFSGVLGFALPNYIGYFRDTIGSYDYIFYINGALGFVTGMMWFFEPYFVKCTESNKEFQEM